MRPRSFFILAAGLFICHCLQGGYVTDGLVLRYDAIDNAGVGVHSDSPSVWSDLSENGHDLTLPASGLTVGADAMTFDHVVGEVSGVDCLTDTANTTNLTLEVVCAADESYSSDTTVKTLVSNPRASIFFRQVGSKGLVGGTYYNGGKCYFGGAHARFCAWNSLQFIRHFHTYSIRTAAGSGAISVDGYGPESKGSYLTALQKAFATNEVDLTSVLAVGSSSALYKIKAVRLYSRHLTAVETAQNAAEDEARFSLKPVDANGNANAFDDAAFYFRAAKQSAGVALDNYEFANALYIGSASSPAGDTFTVGGDRNSIAVETMDVPAPYAGKTLRNRSVVHFKQPYNSGDTSKASAANITLQQPVAATNRASYTVMLRFKVESRINPAEDATTAITLMELGYGWSGQSGLSLKLAGPADNLYVRAYHGGAVDDFKDMQDDQTKTLKIGEWVDMALVVENRVNRLYYKTESGTWYEGSKDEAIAVTTSNSGLYKLALGGPIDGVGIGTSAISSDTYAFRGWYQQVATWDRALTRDEVLNAFRDGCADGDEWRIGVANDMSLEFAGRGAADLASINDWRNMTNELKAANASVGVNFDLAADSFARTRTFKFKSTSISAGGTFNLAVNGRTVAENVAATAGQSAAVTIPGGFFASGANTLAVTRTDANAGTMAIDCMSLLAAEGDLPPSGVVAGDPFSSAYRWWRDDGEAFRDVLRTAYRNSDAHKFETMGQADNVVHSKVSVNCPYSGVTLADEDCIYFKQESYTNANGVIYGKGGCLKATIFPVTNAVGHTSFVRFKIDSFQNPTNCQAEVFTTDYDWTGNRGMALALVGDDPENLCLRIYGGKTSLKAVGMQSGEIRNRLSQGKWIDLAVVVSNSYAYAYVCVEGGDFMVYGPLNFGRDGTPAAAGRFCLGADRTGYSSWTTAATSYFRGWMHQSAVWPRALSEKEVRAVFGFPSPEIARIGVENGSAAEFRGSAAASYVYPENADFRDAPSVIPAGGSLALTFDLPATEVKNQLLKIAAAPESAAATFTVSINGRNVVSYDDNNAPVTSFSVAPGCSSSFGVLAEYLASGANTLTITRTDSNADAFAVDALSFGNGGGRVRIGRQGLIFIVE